MSQIIRPTFVSPSRHGISWYVLGSGMATMSDSSIALKPVIDEPSKPIPSSSAPSISLGVTAKLFRWPSMSVNQSSTNSTPSSSIRFSTSLRAPGSLVARFAVSTCAMQFLPRQLDGGSLRLNDRGQLRKLGLVATVAERAPVERQRGCEQQRTCADRRTDAPDVADDAEHRTAARLADRVGLAGDRDHRRTNARVG